MAKQQPKAEQDKKIGTESRPSSPVTQNSRDRQAQEDTLAHIKAEGVGYWRWDSLNPAQAWISAEDDAKFMAALPEIESIDKQSTADLVRSEMQPSTERHRRESEGPSQATIDLIKAEFAASHSTQEYGGPATDLKLKAHPRVAEIEAALARRGLPKSFKR